MNRIVQMVVVLTVAMASDALGNNNLFLPGDAFFPTTLTEQDLERLSKSPPSDQTFEYSSFDGYPMAFCGNAGFRRVKFDSVNDQFVENLKEVYREIRSWQPRELREEKDGGTNRLIETNGVRVLLYRSDFPFPGASLGLRYNENWVSEAVRFGHQREHLRLCCLISHPDAIATSWRDAPTYPGLSIQSPDAMKKQPRSSGDTVRVTDEIKAIVICNYDLKDLFQPGEQFFRVYVVDSSGFEELNFDGDRWLQAEDTGPF